MHYCDLFLPFINEHAEQSIQKPIAIEVDCWHHLRNVWIGGMNKAVTKFLKKALKFDLNEIDRRLRVGTNIESLIRAVGKYYGL